MKTKYIIFTLIFTLTSITFCKAQQIEIKTFLGDDRYLQDGDRVSMGTLIKMMNAHPDAKDFMKKAKSNNLIATILGGAGGGFIGYPVGTALGGGDANWSLAGIGAGLIIVGIPFSLAANKNGEKAVDLYNSSLTATNNVEFLPEFKILANFNGIGFAMNF